MKKNIVLFIGTAALIQGCSQKPLTQPQIERLSATSGNLVKLANLVQEVAQTQATPQAKAKIAALEALEVFAASVNASRETELEEVKSRMQKAMTSGDCAMPTPFPDAKNVPNFNGTGETKIEPLHFAIKGDRCPIALDLSIEPLGDSKNGTVNFKVMFAVADDKIKALADTERFELSGKMQNISSMPEMNINDRSELPNFAVKNEISLELTLHSQSEGIVRGTMLSRREMRMEAKANRAAFTNELTFTTQFKDFTVEIIGNGDEQGKLHFTLNGQEKTEEELSEILLGNKLAK